jgi:putative membrane protein
MKPVLSENDRNQLETRIKEAEKITKTQIVLATVKRSDSYAEIPWKAFSLATSIMCLIVFTLDLTLFSRIMESVVLISIVTILAAAAFTVMLTLLLPGFARLFLSGSRAETETRQYAESLFLSRELFSTTHRKGILLLLSRFERKVVFLPDKGLSGQISKDDLKAIIELMKRPLAHNEFRLAMDIALDELIRIIKPVSSDVVTKDELSNEIIEGKVK